MPVGAADPVAPAWCLHPHPASAPGCRVRSEQLLGVGGDPQKPHRYLPAHHRRAGAPAAAVDDLLVCQHRPVDRIPVDRPGGPVGQALLPHAQEQQLLPAVVGRIAGRKLALPVDRESQLHDLGAHLVDVGCGPLGRVPPLADGGVLGRQPEGVPAHRLQDVAAVHAPVPGQCIADRVVAHVSHVQPAGGVGQHRQAVVLAAAVAFLGAKAPCILPASLNDSLDIPVAVFLIHVCSNGWFACARKRLRTGRGRF